MNVKLRQRFQLYAAMLEEADSDPSKTIDELMHEVEAVFGNEDAVMQQTFDEWDVDSTGLLSTEDIEAVLNDMTSGSLTPMQLKAGVPVLDREGLGKVSFEMFKHWWVKEGASFQMRLISAESEEELALNAWRDGLGKRRLRWRAHGHALAAVLTNVCLAFASRCVWSFRHHSPEKDCHFPFTRAGGKAMIAEVRSCRDDAAALSDKLVVRAAELRVMMAEARALLGKGGGGGRKVAEPRRKLKSVGKLPTKSKSRRR